MDRSLLQLFSGQRSMLYKSEWWNGWFSPKDTQIYASEKLEPTQHVRVCAQPKLGPAQLVDHTRYERNNPRQLRVGLRVHTFIFTISLFQRPAPTAL